MEYDSVLGYQSISGKNVSLILCVWKPCYVKSGHICVCPHVSVSKSSKSEEIPVFEYTWTGMNVCPIFVTCGLIKLFSMFCTSKKSCIV